MAPAAEVADVEIILKVRPDIALALRAPAPPTSAAAELVRTVEGLGGTLSPLHPEEADPLLAPFYRVEVEEGTTQRALDALLASDGVDGAYVKPLDEPP